MLDLGQNAEVLVRYVVSGRPRFGLGHILQARLIFSAVWFSTITIPSDTLDSLSAKETVEWLQSKTHCFLHHMPLAPVV